MSLVNFCVTIVPKRLVCQNKMPITISPPPDMSICFHPGVKATIRRCDCARSRYVVVAELDSERKSRPKDLSFTIALARVSPLENHKSVW